VLFVRVFVQRCSLFEFGKQGGKKSLRRPRWGQAARGDKKYQVSGERKRLRWVEAEIVLKIKVLV
jgi:hypothetical protein